MEKILKKIQDHLENSQKILILLHLYPDGDTIASALALSLHLKSLGKEVCCAVNDTIPEVFNFLPGVGEIRRDFLLGDYDLVIAIDCGDTNRTGYPIRLQEISRIKTFINIDHHSRSNLYKIAKVNLIDEHASATAELVWKLLNFVGAKIDSKIATLILAGIYFDTGGFKHSNVTEETLKIAGECLRHGARMSIIANSGMVMKSPAGLKLWGIALKKMKIGRRGVVTSFLSLQDIEEAGAKIDDASGIVNLINTVPEARLAILFVEQPDGKIRASLRTESDKIDVAGFARIFGGGGHKKASGFTLEKGDWEKIYRMSS